nr:hypothetical protein [uncultured Cohaesibacter sp.]
MTITVDLSQLVTAETKASTALEAAKAKALATVTDQISVARGVLMTDLIGQEMIYLAKEQEAKDWQASESPDLADFPLMFAEVGITASTADELATLWLTMANQWRQTAASLEAIRLKSKSDIKSAASAEAVQSVVDAIEWPA